MLFIDNNNSSFTKPIPSNNSIHNIRNNSIQFGKKHRFNSPNLACPWTILLKIEIPIPYALKIKGKVNPSPLYGQQRKHGNSYNADNMAWVWICLLWSSTSQWIVIHMGMSFLILFLLVWRLQSREIGCKWDLKGSDVFVKGWLQYIAAAWRRRRRR